MTCNLVADVALLAGNVAAAEWFSLDAPPDPATVAHEGWALDVLSRVAS